jgi:assimilatory nitrate reductase catalytic subunit
MTRTRTICPYCGVGCGLSVDATQREADIRGDENHPANFGRLCSKGAALAETLDLDGRLLHPSIDGRRSSWDDALALVAERFSSVIAEHGPDAVAFYVSGQLLTEDYYVANKLMKGYIGSANIDTNSRLCMASPVAAYHRAFGADFVPSAYEDIEQADLLVIIGSNMAWCHPVLYQRARRAKERRGGVKVVVIDPRRTASCDIADLHLALRPGTDVVLFNGLLNYLRREDALDWEYLDAHTEGFGPAMRVARDTAASIPHVAAACGLAEAEVSEFYRLFAGTEKALSLFSQGVNQSTSGTDKVNSIINVHLATGRIGKPGTGPFSLTGQPNAMGGREVGGLANQLAAHMDFSPQNVARVSRFWNTRNVAAAPGLKAVDLFDAIHRGDVKAVWIMSTNPVDSMPNADRVKRALERCELVVVSDCMRETDTAELAHVLLPAATWGEKSGTTTNSERCIARQRAFLPMPGESRPDWWIVSEVAKRMGFAGAFSYSGPAEIFREHARLSAFENDGKRAFDIGGLAGISDCGYDELEPTRWPRPAGGAGPGEPIADGRFFTSNGKARFIATEPRSPLHGASTKYSYVLLTGRTRDHWHTMTRTGKSPRLSQTNIEPHVQVHPRDAADLGLTHGGLARLSSRWGEMQARVEVTDAVRRGELFAPMHWTAQFASLGRVGSVVGPGTDPVSGQPELKHTPVKVDAIDVAWYGFMLSRRKLETAESFYAVRSRGRGFWRYEIAGQAQPESWPADARRALGADGEWVELVDASRGYYRGACLRNGRLAACIFISTRNLLPDRAWLGSLFEAGMLENAARSNILTARPLAPDSTAGPIVCACFAVGRDTLIRTIASQRLTAVQEIGALLKAGTNCGSCIPELNDLLDRCERIPGDVAVSSPNRDTDNGTDDARLGRLEAARHLQKGQAESAANE